MSQLSTKIAIIGIITALGCSTDKKEKKTVVAEPTPPNTCVTIAIVGQFPDGQTQRQTYMYGCFEGYEIWNGRKLFMADSACREGVSLSNNTDFPFKQLDSKNCPTENVTYSCSGDTWKVLGYQQPTELFSLQQFKDYCTSKNGTFEDKT